MFQLETPIQEIPTYNKDKRKPLKELYESFLKLSSEKWNMEIIYNQEIVIDEKKYNLPIFAFKTKKTGRALWILGGIHGEEPAGPNAIAKNINLLNKLAKDIPIVFLPMCNPKGYIQNWRYPTAKKIKKNMKIIPSVGGSEHYLIDEKSQTPKPRANQSPCIEALKITRYTIRTSKQYSPILSIDLHEDYGNNKVYIYSQGELGSNDPVAKEIVTILKRKGFNFYEQGKTMFNEIVENGIVSNNKDSSIDELISSKKIIIGGRIIKGPSAKSVIVVETPSKRIPLKKRVSAHSIILKNLKRYFSMAKKISKENTKNKEENYKEIKKDDTFIQEIKIENTN